MKWAQKKHSPFHIPFVFILRSSGLYKQPSRTPTPSALGDTA